MELWSNVFENITIFDVTIFTVKKKAGYPFVDSDCFDRVRLNYVVIMAEWS